MRSTRLILLSALLATACIRQPGAASPAAAPAVPPARGALEIVVEPNPIVAAPAGDGVWEFPFALSIRETGGSEVTIHRVGIDVLTFGGLKVYGTELSSAEIDRRGYPRRVPPHGRIRYAMSPKQNVPDERLFASVWGELWVEGTDEAGRSITTKTRATIRKE
ncbi:MAG TPA: hypothetical protein VM557_09920 [Thermoanaerobaculia bacterium]|nr:hypothetical protein [Thermoanaerobaculia bacterium]